MFCSTTNETGLARSVRQDTQTQTEILRNQEGALHGCITLTPLDSLLPFPTPQDHGGVGGATLPPHAVISQFTSSVPA